MPLTLASCVIACDQQRQRAIQPLRLGNAFGNYPLLHRNHSTTARDQTAMKRNRGLHVRDLLVPSEHTISPHKVLIEGLHNFRSPTASPQAGRWLDVADSPIRSTNESFEYFDSGSLRKVETSYGTWLAESDHAEITAQFAHTGKQCLHLHGGDSRTVTLRLNKTAPQKMSLWAERWTSQIPFMFRIDALVGNQWQKIFNGDKTIQVGRRFKSQIKINLPKDVTAIRFQGTSPPNSGVLLDDLVLSEPKNMSVVGSYHTDWVAPILRGKINPITQVSIPATGSENPVAIAQLQVRFTDDTDLSQIKTVHALGQALPADRSLEFNGQLLLADGNNTISVSVKPSPDADLSARVTAKITKLTLDNGSSLRPSGSGTAQRIGIALRTAGQDGCHTYRIPGLSTTNEGTLIAVYDNRYRSGGDLPGDIDVGMSRSTDGGSTWEAMRKIMDMGDEPKWQFDGIGDPAVLVDKITNRIWVAATWSHGNRSWHGSGPGMKPSETGQLMLVHSDDDGKSWSKPNNITRQVKNPNWRFVLQGPGRGLTMKDGTLVFAAQYRSADDGPHQGKPFSTMISSRDRGQSWQIGNGAKVDTTESQLVELQDGVLMINCRDDRGGSRSVYTTSDLGKTWVLHPTSRQALIEPTCMASLLRIDHDTLGRLLVFSNPNTRTSRQDMTLKVSIDDGQTWPRRLHTLYDQRPGAGYSCLTRVDEDHIGVLYEGNREIYYLRFTIRELLGK